MHFAGYEAWLAGAASDDQRVRCDWAIEGQLYAGPGVGIGLPELARDIGRRFLLVRGSGALERGGPAAAVIEQLETDGLLAEQLIVEREPDIYLVTAGAMLASTSRLDGIIAIGGGSVLDAAKAVAGLCACEAPFEKHFEIVGEGLALPGPVLPVIAAPTTAGTGSEVTRNAVVAFPDRGLKVSLRDPRLLPRAAVVDPRFTYYLPPAATASSGLDALTQLIESCVSCRATRESDAHSLRGLRLASEALPRVYHEPHWFEGRNKMAIASLLSGKALAAVGLGAVHGIAGPLGGAFSAPHGAICAALLPHVTCLNLSAVQRAGDGAKVARYQEIAAILSPLDPTPRGLVARLKQLIDEMGISGLRKYGLTAADAPTLAAMAQSSSSIRSNPVPLSTSELQSAIVAAM